MKLSEEIINCIQDPHKIKTLTTVDKDGMPHTVPIGSMTVLDDGNIAFMELLDSSKTQKNMLNCLWFNKEVSILLVDDWENGKAFQIKANPYKFLILGPIWEKFLEQVWQKIPDADPSGVWLITPKEIRNQDYFERRRGEEERRANWITWHALKGART